MKLQQKHKPPNSLVEGQQRQIGLSSDLRRLVDLWLSNTVDEFYQNKVMAYLDQFENKSIQLRQIKKQIELTLKKQSIFFMIRHLLQQKDQLLDSLNKQMQTLQKYCNVDNQEEPDLEPVSNILNDLRQSHMLIVEAFMQFLQKYKVKNYRQTEGEHNSILECISTNIDFLKHSVLKYYIPFAEELDLLFVQQSRGLKKNYKENKIVYNKHIEKFLTLTPSFMYRLLRAKKNIDKLMVMQSENQDNFHQPSQDREQIENSKDTIEQRSQLGSQHSMNWRAIEQDNSFDNQPTSQKVLQSKKIVLSFKLDNSAYMMDQNKPKSRANTRDQTIQIFQQKYKRNTVLPEGIVHLSRNGSRQNQNRIEPQTKSKSTALKIEAKSVEVYVGEPKHIPRLKLSPPILKIDIKSQVKDRKQNSTKIATLSSQFQEHNNMPKQSRKTRDEVMQYSPIEILSKNKRFYLLELQKDSRISEQYSQPIIKRKKQYQRIVDDKSFPRRLQSIDSIYFKNKLKPQQDLKFKRNKNHFSGKFDQPISQKQLKQIQYRETHKNFLNSFQNNPHRPKHEQKYAQHDNKKQQNRELNQEQQDFLQRQKQLIAKINKKYRQLAMKEKEYQLSKLGHNLYNRDKVTNKQKVSPTRKYKLNINDP